MLPFAATWMDLEVIILSEVSQTEKDKYDIAYMWNLKKMVQTIGCKIGSKMYCTTRRIQPIFCNNCKWKVTFKTI